MRRTERLFAIAEALRARRSGVTAEALAERFSVSVRTIYRDLDALRAASLPLAADRGRGGGYALDRTYALPPVNFNAREAALLVALGKWVTDLRLLPMQETLSSALDKVRAALPRDGQHKLEQLLAGVSFVGVPAQRVPDEVRKAVERAWFEGAALRIVYRRANEERTTRTVRIASFVLERTETLLNCEDLERGESRQFRLHRIERATVIEPVADVPTRAT